MERSVPSAILQYWRPDAKSGSPRLMVSAESGHAGTNSSEQKSPSVHGSLAVHPVSSSRLMPWKFFFNSSLVKELILQTCETHSESPHSLHDSHTVSENWPHSLVTYSSGPHTVQAWHEDAFDLSTPC